MDIFNQGKSLLQDVFYTDIRHFNNFIYMRSVFTHKWYNLIVPSVPPANVDIYNIYKILDEEARNNYEVSFYIPHHLYAAYKPFLQQKQWKESADDVYIRYLTHGGETQPQGDFQEVTPQLLETFIKVGNECFPEWNTEEYSAFCLKIHQDLLKNEDKKNSNILVYERGEAVAFGSLLTSQKLKLGYIHNTGTKPSQQRKGYFSKLIHYFLHQSASEGIEIVYANGEHQGASFHGFLKLGFLENCRYHLFSK